MTKVEGVGRDTSNQRFAPIDAVVADMPPVARACSTCRFADIPAMPDDLSEGWIAHCTAPVPINTMLHATRVQMSFPAADAARWDSKRQKPCSAWAEREFVEEPTT